MSGKPGEGFVRFVRRNGGGGTPSRSAAHQMFLDIPHTPFPRNMDGASNGRLARAVIGQGDDADVAAALKLRIDCNIHVFRRLGRVKKAGGGMKVI